MKKGLLQIVVEIDYDKMITEDNITALQGFIGRKNADELMKLHMTNLSDKIVSILEDLPNIRYNIDGRFIPIEKPVVEEEPLRNLVTEYIEEEPVIDETAMNNALAQMVTEEDKARKNLINMLNEDLTEVAMMGGIPQRIIVNGLMLKAIEDETGIKAGQAGTVSKYQGFPIVSEGMEEFVIIEYKTIGSNEIKTYTNRGGSN